jgi:CRP-like cAMP-binding protein
MREHAPITIQRVLALRQLPGFGDADLSELATIAENVVERAFPAGATVAAPGSRVPTIHLVVEGRLAATRSRRAWGPRQLLGALEVLAGRPSPERVIAVQDTRTLQLAADDLGEILEDNYGVLSIARRALAGQLLARRAAPTPRPPAPVHERAGSLGIVDRLAILHAQAPFAGVSLQALSTLAQATEELRLPGGAPICRAGEEAGGLLVILDGAARTLRAGARIRLAAGVAVGALEVLAELPHAGDVDAATAVRALRLPAPALLDVMEDHTDFAIALVGRLAGALLDHGPLPAEVN